MDRGDLPRFFTILEQLLAEKPLAIETVVAIEKMLRQAGLTNEADILSRNLPRPFAFQNQPIILVLFYASIGEVDWLLPVLCKLKEIHPEFAIVALIHPIIQQKLVEASFHFARLQSVAHVLPCSETNPLARIDTNNIVLFLRSDDPDVALHRELRNQIHSNIEVVFPSGTAIITRRTDDLAEIARYYANSSTDTQIGYQSLRKAHQLWLTTSPELEPMALQFSTPDRIVHAGCTRYDPWWIDESLHDPALTNSREMIFSNSASRRILLITRGPHRLYHKTEDYQFVMRQLADLIATLPDTVTIIKPHPRQDQAELEHWFDAVPKNKWMMSHLSLTQLASLTDGVISMFSSGVMDALAVGVPVVEYYRYPQDGQVLEFRQLADGRRGSIYEALGLVANAGDIETLSKIVSGWNRTTHQIPEAVMANYRLVTGIPEGSAERTARILSDKIISKALPTK